MQLGQLVHALEERAPAARTARAAPRRRPRSPAPAGSVMRAALRMTPSWNSARCTWPLASSSSTTDWVSRSWPSTRLQMSLREGVGQHGHHAVREVDGGAAQVGLLVEGRCPRGRSGPRRRCGRPGASGRSESRSRLMASSWSRAVSGSTVTVAQGRKSVRPAMSSGRHGLRHARRLGLHLRREGVGQVVLGHDDLRGRRPGPRGGPGPASTRPAGLRVAVGGRVISASDHLARRGAPPRPRPG